MDGELKMEYEEGTALWLALIALGIILVFIVSIWLGGTKWIYDFLDFFKT